MKLKKILIDARMIRKKGHGIAVYLSELLGGLKELFETRLPSYSITLLIHPDEKLNPVFQSFQTIPLSTPFLSPLEWIHIPKILKQNQISLYHSPSFASLPYCPCPSMITIHDLNHLFYGSIFQKTYYHVLLRRFALNSHKITTVSQFSKDELTHWLKLPNKEIDIIPNPIDISSIHNVSEKNQYDILLKYKLEKKKYFLCVSNEKEHKNTHVLLTAYNKFRSQTSNLWPLAITHSLIPDHLKQGVVQLNSLEKNELLVLMKNCSGLLSPSLYEGFGRTPVEAALCGAPVVASNIPSHIEAFQEISNFPCFVDPNNTLGWVDALQLLSDHKIKCLNQEESSLLNIKYDKKICSEKLDQVYTNVLKSI